MKPMENEEWLTYRTMGETRFKQGFKEDDFAYGIDILFSDNTELRLDFIDYVIATTKIDEFRNIFKRIKSKKYEHNTLKRSCLFV